MLMLRPDAAERLRHASSAVFIKVCTGYAAGVGSYEQFGAPWPLFPML